MKSPNHFSTLTLSILTISLSLSLSLSSSSPSIYDILSSHSLPIGLFPKGITNFTIDSSTGKFEVYLQQSCNAKFESNVRYDLNVSGTIRVGQLGELSGIAAQELFLWFPVKGIRVDIPSSGLIYFDVGVVFKQFSVSSFESPRECLGTEGWLSEADGLVLVDKLHGGQDRLEQPQSKYGKADALWAVS
ncbi:uncharacterized protein At5g01610-like [Apium graveolens]|uniref:uncharacterized protein At5g01610-like n=1 Tax=Apium graveolens TaxID=4045 RepID=UPI003D7AA778